MRGSTRVGTTTLESVALNAPGTTRAYGCGSVRSNKLARVPAAVTTESSTRLKPGMLSALRAPAGVIAKRTASRSQRWTRSEEHTSELQSPCNLVCRLLLEKKKKQTDRSNLT